MSRTPRTRSTNRTKAALPSRSVSIRVAGAACGLLFLAGCANRPTTTDLGESILNASESDPSIVLSSDEAECIAQLLIDSDLSDTTLSGLVENFNEPEVLAAEADDVTPAVAAAAEACVAAG